LPESDEEPRKEIVSFSFPQFQFWPFFGRWICDGCRDYPRETAVASEDTPSEETFNVADESHVSPEKFSYSSGVGQQVSSQREHRRRSENIQRNKRAADGSDRKQHHIQQLVGQQVSSQMMPVESPPTPPRPNPESPKVRPNN
jgi:hypothetical protein